MSTGSRGGLTGAPGGDGRPVKKRFLPVTIQVAGRAADCGPDRPAGPLPIVVWHVLSASALFTSTVNQRKPLWLQQEAIKGIYSCAKSVAITLSHIGSMESESITWSGSGSPASSETGSTFLRPFLRSVTSTDFGLGRIDITH